MGEAGGDDAGLERSRPRQGRAKGRRSRAKPVGAEPVAGKTPTAMLVDSARMLGVATVAPVPESRWECQGDQRARRRR